MWGEDKYRRLRAGSFNLFPKKVIFAGSPQMMRMMNISVCRTRSLVFCFLLSIRSWAFLSAENLDSILRVLDTCVADKAKYESRFLRTVDSLRMEAEICDDSSRALQLWTIIGKHEYRHNGDKALEAINEAIRLARMFKNERRERELITLKASTYGMLGIPWEGERLLDSLIRTSGSESGIRNSIYVSYYDLYDFYDAYALPGEITDRNYAFRASIQDSVRKHLSSPARQAMTIHYTTYDEHQMIRQLKEHFEVVPDEEKGIVANVISNKYFMLRDIRHRNYYWALAAIWNLRTARHENEALTRLAIYLFEAGDTERAIRYTEAAFDDARTYNTRIRKVEVAAPLAQGMAYRNRQKEDAERRLIRWQVLSAMLLGVLLFGGGWITLRRRKERARAKATEQTCLAHEENIGRLSEEIRTKDDYVTRFLELSLDSIYYLEQLRSTALVKLNAGEAERLQKQLKDASSINDFRQTCLRRFDIAFLRLYPGFTKTVNRLLRADEQLELPDTEFLNNELRTLAFMRIGIVDSLRIAAILGVSVNTVYFYRNKLRRKAIDRDNFERDFMQLTDAR